MFVPRHENKYHRNYNFPLTKLRNVYCTHCKHQFYVEAFVPLRGTIPLLMECGHVICDKCAKSIPNNICSLCNVVFKTENNKRVLLPLNMYTLGLMVVSHNRPINVDDSNISFSKPTTSNSKQHRMQGLCHECGIQALVRCPQCDALYCLSCYAKIHGRALNSHSKIMLSDVQNDDSCIIQNTCSERCKEALEYYCENCEIAGCPHCMLNSHKNHNYISLLDKNQLFLEEFQQMFECVVQRLLRVRQAQKKLRASDTTQKKIQNSNNMETTIAQHFCYLHGVLQNMERKLIDSLHQQCDILNKNVEDVSMQLKEHEEHLQNVLRVIEPVEENLDKIDIQRVLAKLKKVIDIPCHLLVNLESSDTEIRFDVDQDIVDTLQKHCAIRMPTISSFSLQRTELLPDDYEMEPLTEEINILKFRDRTFSGMKPASPTASLPRRMSDDYPEIGCSEMIRVTHVANPFCFYVQLMLNQNKLLQLGQDLMKVANNSGVIPIDVKINTMYIVQSAKNRAWLRGRVVDKKTDCDNEEKYTIFFVDYGTKEQNVSLARMRNIDAHLARIPILALRCALYEVVPNGNQWTATAIQAFEKLVCTNSMVSMSVSSVIGDTYYVDICVVSSKDAGLINVKDSLTFMKYATCVSSNKLMRMNPYSTRTYFKEELLIETFTLVEILFIESPSCIYVTKKYACRTEFNKMACEMMEDYEQVGSTDYYISAPCKDLPCAARGVDGRWHRGIICDITENTVKVFFVDSGYSLILSYDGIRTLHQKYMSSRTQAIKLSLRNIKPLSGNEDQWEPEASEYLKKYFKRTTQVNVIALDKFGDTYSVCMYTNNNLSVSEMLLRENLAMTTKTCSNSNTNKAAKIRKRKQKRILTHVYEPMQPKNPQMQECSKKTSESLSATPIMTSSIINSSVTNSSVMDSSVIHSNIINSSTRSRIEIKENEDPFKVEVMVHHVESPDCIYVSDATGERGNIDNMIQQMQKFYSHYHSTDPESWNLGTVCAVKLPLDNMYYRGTIVEMKVDDQVAVFLYDVGHETVVPKKNLQLLYPPFFKVPTYIFKIKLAGILPCGGSDKWPSLSCHELKEITNTNYSCKFYISKLEDEDVKDSAIPVELWIKQNKTDGPLCPSRIEINSINRMLVEKGVALPIKEYAKKRDKILAIELKLQLAKKLNRFTKSESNAKWFKINDKNESDHEADPNKETKIYLQYSDSSSEDTEEHTLEEMLENIPSLSKLTAWLPAEDILEETFIAVPTYLDHDGFIYLHSTERNTKILSDIENKLEKLYKNCEIESYDTTWAVGNMCIAEYHANKKWYRGKVVKVLGNDVVEVEFVDYGNIEECFIGTLKKKVVLENIPIQCTKCIIHGLISGNANEKWTTQELDRMHNLLIDKKCIVSILNRTETFYIISIKIYLNEQTNETSDLISFLINNWSFCIKHDIESTEPKPILPITSDAMSVDMKLLSSDEEVEEKTDIVEQEIDEIISGYSQILSQSNVINTIDNCDSDSISTQDTDNLSWSRTRDNFVVSTPFVASEEDLAMNYQSFNIPKTIEYIKIELCCSISATKFHAQLKENKHSVILNAYHRQYKQLMKDLEENASKQPMITDIIPNTPCCARFEDNVWYRCLIIEANSTEDSNVIEVKLLYVDYGNDEYRKVNLHESELHSLKKEWINVPTLAIKCKLWNVVVSPSANLDILLPKIEKMYEKPVVATIKEVDGEFTSVELYENKDRKELLYSSLINEGLFKTIIN